MEEVVGEAGSEEVRDRVVVSGWLAVRNRREENEMSEGGSGGVRTGV